METIKLQLARFEHASANDQNDNAEQGYEVQIDSTSDLREVFGDLHYFVADPFSNEVTFFTEQLYLQMVAKFKEMDTKAALACRPFFAGCVKFELAEGEPFVLPIKDCLAASLKEGPAVLVKSDDGFAHLKNSES